MNLGLFTEVIDELKSLINKKQAKINFRRDGISLLLTEKPKEGLLSDLEKNELSLIINEIIDIVRLLLKEDDNFKIKCNNEPELAQKTDLINNSIITEDLKKEYFFLRFSVSDVIKSINFQPIIKPVNATSSPLVTGILNITFLNGAKDEINIEVTYDTLNDMIKSLSEYSEKLRDLQEKVKDLNI